MTADLLCIAVITAPQGVRGKVKVKSFAADPESIFDYSPLCDATGSARFYLQPRGVSGTTLLASIEGVSSREAAEALKGQKLYIHRAQLPPPDEDEFYIEDLIGLTAVMTDDEIFGTVSSIENYGAGDLVEITTAEGEKELFAFTHETFPEIDLSTGRLVIELPEIIEGEDEDAPAS